MKNIFSVLIACLIVPVALWAQIDYEQILCVGVDGINLTNKDYTYDCIYIDSIWLKGDRAVPITIEKKGYRVDQGYFVHKSHLNFSVLNCNSNFLNVYYHDPSFEEIERTNCLGFRISFSRPYVFEQDFVFLTYYYSCGISCGEGWSAIVNISDPDQYRLVSFDMSFVD